MEAPTAKTDVDVHRQVETYCRKYAIQPPFKISEPYDLQADWKAKGYPFATDYGCYVFYSESKTLLYIGKASLADLGSRLSTYFLRDWENAKFKRLWRELTPRYL
jgi:hypothetical protein